MTIFEDFYFQKKNADRNEAKSAKFSFTSDDSK